MIIAVETIETVESKVLQILAVVTQTDEVQRNLDLALFDEGVLDSLGMVELILALSDVFGITISPAEIDRSAWASPRNIITFMEQKITP